MRATEGMRQIVPPAVIGLMNIWLAGTAVSADCPPTCMRFSWSGEFCTTAASLDTAAATGGECFDRLVVQLNEGLLATYSWANFGSCSNTIEAQDRFTVFGLTEGTPIALYAELALRLEVSGGGYLEGSLQFDDASIAVWQKLICCSPEPWAEADTLLRVPVVAQAGYPFTIRYTVYVSAGGESFSGANAQLSFGELPPRVSIVSCHGYTQEGTQTRTTTWGRLKAVFR